jgi:hypothetical protein
LLSILDSTPKPLENLKRSCDTKEASVILPPAGFVIPVPTSFDLAGFDPHEERVRNGFHISGPMLQELEDYGPDHKLWDAFLVPPTLETPTVILEGLKRTNYEQGLCYCAMPSRRWVNATDTAVPPRGKVFCVYANPVGSDFQVLDWEWRRVGLGATGIPYRWQKDFTRILWPTS